jgi:hypothetical protein
MYLARLWSAAAATTTTMVRVQRTLQWRQCVGINSRGIWDSAVQDPVAGACSGGSSQEQGARASQIYRNAQARGRPGRQGHAGACTRTRRPCCDQDANASTPGSGRYPCPGSRQGAAAVGGQGDGPAHPGGQAVPAGLA